MNTYTAHDTWVTALIASGEYKPWGVASPAAGTPGNTLLRASDNAKILAITRRETISTCSHILREENT